MAASEPVAKNRTIRSVKVGWPFGLQELDRVMSSSLATRLPLPGSLSERPAVEALRDFQKFYARRRLNRKHCGSDLIVFKMPQITKTKQLLDIDLDCVI